MSEASLQHYLKINGYDEEHEDVKAYKANHDVFKGGLSKHEVAQYYSKWAEDGLYDEHLNQDRYQGPEVAARALAEHFTITEAESARMLDVAAGTGRLGAELYRLGFQYIDALDPSEGMLNKAKERGVYTNFINEFIDNENPLNVDNDTYCGLAVCGGFGEGHIPCEALLEMIRIVKPGGVICIAMREEYLDYVSEYKDTMLPLMQNLEKDGKWKQLKKDVLANYAFGKPGVIFHYGVL